MPSPESSNTWICQVPEAAGFSQAAKKIAQVKVTAHEFAHTVTNMELRYDDAGMWLKMPDGRVTKPSAFMEDFRTAALNHPPISRYSADYRTTDGQFRHDHSHNNIPENEELAEAVAAHLLGFTVDPQGTINFSPFEGREEIQQMVVDYLQAKRILQ